MSKEDKNIWEGNASTRNESDYIRTAKTGASALDIDLRRILALWPFILLFGLLGFAVGSIYLRYITPIYTLSTSISIE
jgi:uncharacterized protein involved in exopolysaccharide biosynthesis